MTHSKRKPRPEVTVWPTGFEEVCGPRTLDAADQLRENRCRRRTTKPTMDEQEQRQLALPRDHYVRNRAPFDAGVWGTGMWRR